MQQKGRGLYSNLLILSGMGYIFPVACINQQNLPPMRLFPASVFLCVVFLLGCNNNRSYEKGITDLSATADSATVSALSSLAAVADSQDTEHKFIRTADLKFKVQSVVQSTHDIEDVTARQGGFVTYTNLSSTIEQSSSVPVSSDSSLETTYFGVTNSMILRVPNNRLDTTLKEIARTVDYLDFRIIKADDVSLQIFSNELAQKRGRQHQNRLQTDIDTRKSKLAEVTQAEEILSTGQEETDRSQIANLALAGQIRYSTVNLNFYQREGVRTETVAIRKEQPPYVPPFGNRLLGSVRSGWLILQELVLFLTRLWPLLLAGTGLYLAYRSLKKQPVSTPVQPGKIR